MQGALHRNLLQPTLFCFVGYLLLKVFICLPSFYLCMVKTLSILSVLSKVEKSFGILFLWLRVCWPCDLFWVYIIFLYSTSEEPDFFHSLFAGEILTVANCDFKILYMHVAKKKNHIWLGPWGIRIKAQCVSYLLLMKSHCVM